MVQDFASTVDPLIENPLLLAAARLRYVLVRHYLWPAGEELLEWMPHPDLVAKNTDLESFGGEVEITPKLEVMKQQIRDRIGSDDFLSDTSAGHDWLSDDQDEPEDD